MANCIFLTIIAGLLSASLTDVLSLPPPYNSNEVPHYYKAVDADPFEVVDSYYLYIRNLEEIDVILDQLEDSFKDLQIQNIRKWFESEFDTVGFILRMPVIKGQEHRYAPILERYGSAAVLPKPSIPVVPQVIVAEPSKPTIYHSEDDDVKLVTTVPPADSFRVINHNIPPTEPLHLREDDELEESNIEPALVPSDVTISETQASIQPETVQTPIYPRYEEVAVPIGYAQHSQVPQVSPSVIKFPVAEREIVLPTARPVSLKPRTVIVENDDVEHVATTPLLASSIEAKPDKALGADWSIINPNSPKYSMIQLYKLFPHIAKMIGYMNAQDCKARELTDTDFTENVSFQKWLTVLHVLEANHVEG